MELGDDEYEALREAVSRLQALRSFEENFDLLFESYKDFERALFNTSLDFATESMWSYEAFHSYKLKLDRVILNMLTVSRLYVDTTQRNALVNAYAQSSTIFSGYYDSTFEYRFCEALRNYCQHNDTPVHSYGGSSHEVPSEPGVKEFSVKLESLRSVLAKDGNFKKSVLNEIKEKTDLKECVRKYFACLANAHQEMRMNCERIAAESRKLLDDVIASYGRLHDGSVTGLACFEGDWQKQFAVMTQWDDIRIGLQKRNRFIQNMALRRIRA